MNGLFIFAFFSPASRCTKPPRKPKWAEISRILTPAEQYAKAERLLAET